MNVTITQTVNLSPVEVDRVVNEFLEKIIDGKWIVGGDIMDEVYTSHRFDTVYGHVEDTKNELLVAAIHFRDALKKSAKEKR